MSSTVTTPQLTLFDLSPDQHEAIDYLYDHDETFLIAGMGSGKTVIALTALQELLAGGIISRVLVLAPLKVCQEVWKNEHHKWTHLTDLNVQVLAGLAESEREIDITAQIVVVNFDVLPWLKKKNLFVLFDALLVDESTKLKAGGAWFKAIRYALPNFKWRAVMSGTPVSENWQQLFYQMMLVDTGKRFGRNKDTFMRRYFYPTDFNNYKWALKPGSEAKLAAGVAPVVHEVPDYRGSLPPLSEDPVMVALPPRARAVYTDMAKGMEAEGVLADTVAVQVMKLRQIAAGFLYDGDDVLWLHDAKLRAVQKEVDKIGKMAVIKSDEKVSEKIGKMAVIKSSAPTSVVLVYQFKEELARLREWLGGRLVTLDDPDAVARWNAGEIDFLALYPGSGGHGLNLYDGGCHIIFLGPVWSRDQYDQTIGRLWRRGQRWPVSVKIIEAIDTVDQLVARVLAEKGELLPLFLQHLGDITGKKAG